MLMHSWLWSAVVSSHRVGRRHGRGRRRPCAHDFALVDSDRALVLADDCLYLFTFSTGSLLSPPYMKGTSPSTP